jgi:glycosyltransferase involved in cell wall biosynthesis
MPEQITPLNIALITHINAGDRRTLSGTPYQIQHLVNRHCGRVTCIDNLIPESMSLSFLAEHFFKTRAYLLPIEILKSRFWRVVKKQYDWRISLNAARFCARQIEKRLSRERFDLIWVEKSSMSMPFVRTAIPIIYESDATFHALLDYYPWFTGLSKSAIRNGETLEKISLDKAAAVVLTADWAKDSAIRDYGIAPEKITVLPSPPNCDHIPDRSTVLREKRHDVCNLLFIGVDWHRKGGDIAVAVTEELNRQGVPARLHLCGCRLPSTYTGHPHLEVIGFLDKNAPGDMRRWERLFLDAHFFILPTRAECMGISFSEAAGFGLPLIATDTGGVSTVVKNGRNGYLFAPDETEASIAMKIKYLWDNPEIYRAMSTESRRFFDEEISEDAWISTVNRLIKALIPHYRPVAQQPL